jgi:hypothetical protein
MIYSEIRNGKAGDLIPYPGNQYFGSPKRVELVIELLIAAAFSR